MTESIKISGKWDFSSIVNGEVYGELYIEPENGVIQLSVLSDESLGLYNEFELISGQSLYGQNITIFKCRSIRETRHIGATKNSHSTVIIAEYVFNGVNFKTKEDVLFHELSFRFSNLDEWAFVRGIELFTVKDSDFSLVYNRPDDVNYQVDKETTVKIHCGLSHPFITVVEKELKITQSVYVSVIHKTPQEFQKSMDIIQKIMGFVSLCIGRKVHLTEIMAHHHELFQDVGGTEKNKIYHDISIHTVYGGAKSYNPVDPRDSLVNLQNILPEFSTYMSNWFEKGDLLRPTIELYLNTLNYSQMSIEQHFLNLVQALESYHRRMKKNYTIDLDTHQQRIKKILEATPEEHKKWLQEKLNFSHEPTLRDRLYDLVPEDEDLFIFFRGSGKHVDDFIKDVKNTRNYHTHYTQKLEKKALKGEDLEMACLNLRFMIEYFLLHEIGLSKEFIHERLMDKSGRIRENRSVVEYHRQKKRKN